MKKLLSFSFLSMISLSAFADFPSGYLLHYNIPQGSDYYWLSTDKNANSCAYQVLKGYQGVVKQQFTAPTTSTGDKPYCPNYTITFNIIDYNICLNASPANLTSAIPAQNGASTKSTMITYNAQTATYSINLLSNPCPYGNITDSTGNTVTYYLYACSLLQNSTGYDFGCCYTQDGKYNADACGTGFIN